MSFTETKIKNLKTLWKIIFFLGLFLWITAFFLKDGLPEVAEISPALLQEPLQVETERQDFSFAYRGKDYEVRPFFDYELWGLVVSHNNIHSFLDIYHTDDSVDIKDVCVIWGPNLLSDDFRKVEFWNVSWTCNWQYDGDVKNFRHREVSNNHLLSDSEAVRAAIRDLHIGDQIHLKGSLVGYAEKGMPYFRNSSTDREDTGNGACEVVFVDEVKILARKTPFWADIFDWGGRFFLLMIILRISLFFMEGKIQEAEWQEKAGK